jgi:hypothetical protein
MDKQNTIYPVEYDSAIEGRNLCSSMGESFQIHSITLSKGSQRQTYCMTTFVTFWKRENYSNRNPNSDCQVWELGVKWWQQSTENFGGDENETFHSEVVTWLSIKMYIFQKGELYYMSIRSPKYLISKKEKKNFY